MPPLFILTQRESAFKRVGHRWQLAGICANQHVRFIQKTRGRTRVFGHAGQGDCRVFGACKLDSFGLQAARSAFL